MTAAERYEDLILSDLREHGPSTATQIFERLSSTKRKHMSTYVISSCLKTYRAQGKVVSEDNGYCTNVFRWSLVEQEEQRWSR